MKWVVGSIAVLVAFIGGFGLGWMSHRPEVLRTERTEVAAASSSSPSSPSSSSPVPSSLPLVVPSATASAAASADGAAFAWPARVAPPHEIVAIDATHYLVDTAFVEDFLTNASKIMASARMVPEVHDGGVVGTKIFGVRADSPLAKLGIMNGDSLRSLNGTDLSDPASVLEAYTRLRGAKHFALVIVRRGAPITLHYLVTGRGAK